MAAVVDRHTWTVSELTEHIKTLLAQDVALRDVWLEGEISNFMQYTSGHCYFSLKDAHATLQCVMWKSHAVLLPELPQDGQHVLVHGHIDVYGPRGTYQLYVDYLRPAGIGDLYAQFEAVKAKLAAEGLFAAERKRPLPPWPRRIGVVTSPDGAALRDIVRVIRSRYAGVELVLSPTLVQGPEAPGRIVAALKALVRYGDVDVIVIARGGGSLEDLWAFNDEQVARAIAACPIPVVSGVGHETDFTIADFVADVRAPTPSAAAMAIVPDGQALKRQITEYQNRLRQLVQTLLATKRQQVQDEGRALLRYHPRGQIAAARQQVDERHRQLRSYLLHALTLYRARLTALEERLHALNPRDVLKRGYAIVQRPDGRPVTSVTQLAVGEHMHVLLQDGRLEAWVVASIPDTPHRTSS